MYLLTLLKDLKIGNMTNIVFLSENTNTTKLVNIIKDYILKNISNNNEKKSNATNLLIDDFLNYINYFVLISKSDYRDNFYKQNFDSYYHALNEIKIKIGDIIKENDIEIIDNTINLWLQLFKTIELEANELNYNYKLIEDAIREINYIHKNMEKI